MADRGEIAHKKQALIEWSPDVAVMLINCQVCTIRTTLHSVFSNWFLSHLIFSDLFVLDSANGRSR